MNSENVRHLYGTPKVGGDTLAYCTRCKIELAHVIVSMIDTRPAKVVCKTCKSQHNYKRIGDLTSRTRSKSTRAPRVTTPAIKVSELWEKKVATSKATPKAYSVAGAYAKGDLIQHTKFGLGLIEDVNSNGKMRVLFRDEERMLISKAGANAATPG